MIPRKILVLSLVTIVSATTMAENYYISPQGNDENPGSLESPFLSLTAAQRVVKPGDNVYFLEGEYKPVFDEESFTIGSKVCAFLLEKSGEVGNPITYSAYPGENVVIDLSEFKTEGEQITGFYITGSNLHIKNLEVIGVQVMVTDETARSEGFGNYGGHNNVFENLSVHDGMGSGFYLGEGRNLKVINCDAYNNYDSLNTGVNSDGFICYPSDDCTGNEFIGCRAWWNGNVGFNLQGAREVVTLNNCWAFNNGYRPGTTKSASIGHGFQLGGFGMDPNPDVPEIIPIHEAYNCLAYANRSGGFYSNDHLGGIILINNTAIDNRWNYYMPNRKSVAEASEVNGYSHFMAYNVAYNARSYDLYKCDEAESILLNNSFFPKELALEESDFQNLDGSQLEAARLSDGSLPEINLGYPEDSSVLAENVMGYSYPALTREEILDENAKTMQWLMAPTLVVENNLVFVEGEGATNLNGVYANGEKMKVSKYKADISEVEDSLITLTATLSNGVVLYKIYDRNEEPSLPNEEEEIEGDQPSTDDTGSSQAEENDNDATAGTPSNSI